MSRHLLFAAVVAACLAPTLRAWELKHYLCSACREVIAYGVHYGGDKFSDVCDKALGKTVCDAIFGADSEAMNSDISKNDDFCFHYKMCDKGEGGSRDYSSYSTESPNVRVSRMSGGAYNKVRLSLVTNSSLSPSEFNFPSAYMNQFKYRWTQFYLASTVVDVTPGEPKTVTVGNHPVTINIPKEGEGVRGIVIGDPCYQSEWVTCRYQDKWNTFETLTGLLNAANAKADDVNFWQLLGDNLYDQNGAATNTWFSALTLETKSKVLFSIPGNHDTYVHGTPKLYTSKDQLQHGFFQYYGQDVVSSMTSPLIPYDFSVDPTGPNTNADTLPPAANLFTYNKLGNAIFIGFSGAHTYESQEKYFVDACTWAAKVGSDVILLEGHWNKEGDGCPDGMSVPDVYKAISSLPACAPLQHKFKYMMGHIHCSQVVEKDVGFEMGAYGMSDGSCDATFGFNVVDTHGGSFKLYNFRIRNEKTDENNYDATLACFKQKGVSGCYDLPNVEVWADVKF